MENYKWSCVVREGLIGQLTAWQRQGLARAGSAVLLRCCSRRCARSSVLGYRLWKGQGDGELQTGRAEVQEHQLLAVGC